MLDDIGKLDIENVVRTARKQRAGAVQTPDQYIFCHLVILLYAMSQGYINDNLDLSVISKRKGW